MNDDAPGTVPQLRKAGPAPSDREWDAQRVRATLDGDDHAFAELFQRYRERVYRIAFRFTRDHDEAMDLTQTTFIKVHQRLSSYREESAFATWLSRIATNCGIDHVRAKKRQAKVNLDDAPELTDQVLPEEGQAGPRLGPGAQYEQAELGKAIQRAVDDLSEKHRSVFVLHCVEGTPYKEIASILDISIGTVMSRLFHARRYLRKSLSSYLGDAQLRTLLGEEAESEKTKKKTTKKKRVGETS
ncbi:MAG: sigma-70 family RNA polymerase sigma factor [Acidobacteriota bacterium]